MRGPASVRRVLLCLALLSAAGPAAAELSIEAVRWELARPARGRARTYEIVEELKTAPPKTLGRLRARLTLKNRGPKPVEGVLLRYGATARLAPEGAAKSGAWAVPFLIDERRVPRVGANQLLEVPIEPSPLLDIYLRKVWRTGFWPDQLKLQVMLEPHRGSVESVALVESVLPVTR